MESILNPTEFDAMTSLGSKYKLVDKSILGKALINWILIIVKPIQMKTMGNKTSHIIPT